MMRELCGKFAGTLRAEIPPYPLEVFPPLRGVGKTSGSGRLGSVKGDVPQPLRELCELLQMAVPDAAERVNYVRPPARGVRHND